MYKTKPTDVAVAESTAAHCNDDPRGAIHRGLRCMKYTKSIVNLEPDATTLLARNSQNSETGLRCFQTRANADNRGMISWEHNINVLLETGPYCRNSREHIHSAAIEFPPAVKGTEWKP